MTAFALQATSHHRLAVRPFSPFFRTESEMKMNNPRAANTTTAAATTLVAAAAGFVGLVVFLCGAVSPGTALPTDAVGGLTSLPEPDHHQTGILPAEPCRAEPHYPSPRSSQPIPDRQSDGRRSVRHITPTTTPDQTHWDEESEEEETNPQHGQTAAAVRMVGRDADGGIVFEHTKIDPGTGMRTIECWHYGCKFNVRTV